MKINTKLSIQLLGTPEIRVADEVVTFRLAKEYALLYYLVATGEQHKRTTLANLFWPDKDPSTGRRYLRNHLVELRRHFSQHMVITTDTLAVDDEAKSAVDVHQLKSLLAYKSPNGNGTSQPNHDKYLAQQRQIIGLYRGDFLDGFSLPETPLFSDWLDRTREEICLHTANLLYHLSQAEIAVGNLTQAHEDLEQVLRLLPWNEEAHQLKMRLLYEGGQRWAALDQYATLRAILHEELDVEPSVETEQLVAQIRADERTATDLYQHDEPIAVTTSAATSAVRMESPPSSSSHQPLSCPVPLVPLVGHQALLTTAVGYLQDPDHRLVTLVGMGGVGKSHIALTLGEMLLQDETHQHFPDGVGFVPLVGVEAIDDIGEQDIAEQDIAEQPSDDLISQETQRFISAIARTLQLPVGISSNGLTQIIGYLKQRRLLLILDNFEHVLGAKQLLTALVQQVPSCTFLVTSRVRLQLLGETIVPVSPLPVEGVSQLDGLPIQLSDGTTNSALAGEQRMTPKQLSEMLPHSENYASTRLFLDYVYRCNADLEIGPRDLAAINKLCYLTGGLPLVLGMVAAWTEHIPLSQIVRQLEKDSRLFVQQLSTDYHPLPDSTAEYHTLDAFFDQSWHLLSSGEQRSTLSLANFVASFELDAAQEIVGMNMLVLKRLADTSLLQVKQVGRYEFHPLIRTYLHDKWESMVAQDWQHEQQFWERYCTYFLQIVVAYAPQLNGENAKDALARLRSEQDHIHLAWRQAIAHDFVTLVQSTFEQLVAFYNRCRFFNETLALCDSIGQLYTSRSADPAYQRFLFLVNLTVIETHVENSQWEEALRLAEVLETELEKEIVSPTLDISPDLEMRFHLAYAYALQKRISVTQGVTYLTEVYNRLAEQISASISGYCHNFFFKAAFYEGDNPGMLDHAEKALADFEQSGNLWESIRVLQLSSYGLGPEQKRRRLEKGLNYSQRVNHVEMEAQCTSTMLSLLGLSQHSQRLKHLHNAITLFEAVGSPTDTYGPILEQIAEYIRLGAYTRAEKLHSHLLTQPYAGDEIDYMIKFQGTMLAFYQGEIKTALHMAEELVEQQGNVGAAVQLIGLFYHGYILMHHEDFAQAHTTFDQLQQMFALIEDGFAFEKRFVNMAVADVAYRQGDFESALVEVERLLPYLGPGFDHGYYISDIVLMDYFRQHWVCYQVLDAIDDARADDVLQSSYAYLQTWADGIEDVELRRSFLENVTVNRMIVEAVEG